MDLGNCNASNVVVIKSVFYGVNIMLECRKCKYEDCDFKKNIFSAIKTIGSYTNYKVEEAIEVMIKNTTESCPDFEEAD
jgi:uncharacterized protein (UPF0179 family)